MEIETNFGYLIAMIVIEFYLRKGFENLSETEDRIWINYPDRWENGK